MNTIAYFWHIEDLLKTLQKKKKKKEETTSMHHGLLDSKHCLKTVYKYTALLSTQITKLSSVILDWNQELEADIE